MKTTMQHSSLRINTPDQAILSMSASDCTFRALMLDLETESHCRLQHERIKPKQTPSHRTPAEMKPLPLALNS